MSGNVMRTTLAWDAPVIMSLMNSGAPMGFDRLHFRDEPSHVLGKTGARLAKLHGFAFRVLVAVSCGLVGGTLLQGKTKWKLVLPRRSSGITMPEMGSLRFARLSAGQRA